LSLNLSFIQEIFLLTESNPLECFNDSSEATSDILASEERGLLRTLGSTVTKMQNKTYAQ